ncbi:hypothetical protein GFS60_05567 [Rhodococcus sp. WAY2]|nr:hypothetical protein GFS60_05567 [Rhodococcus sp. WAY2]
MILPLPQRGNSQNFGEARLGPSIRCAHIIGGEPLITS